MNDLSDQINICFSSDENYVAHTAVCIGSVVAHRRSNEPLHFTILDAGISGGSIAELSSYAESLRVTISFVDMRASIPDALSSPSWTDTWSPAMYARLFIPRALSYSRVIYLDGDTTVHAPIEDLWRVDLNGASLAAAFDPAIVPGRRPSIRRVGSYPDKHIDLEFFHGTWSGYFRDYLGLDQTAYGNYFNSGVLVMDLDKIRSERSDETCLAKINRPYAYGDQCILNSVYCHDVHRLPPTWNCFNIPARKFRHLSDQALASYKRAQRRPAIVHHVKKPFRNRFAKFSGLYWKYLAKTPWNHRVRRRYMLLATAVGFVKFIGVYPLLFKATRALKTLAGIRVRFF